MVKRWNTEKKMGRTSTSVEPRIRRSVEVTTLEIVETMPRVALEGERLMLFELVEAVNI